MIADGRLFSIVRRLALAFALTATLALPGGYFYLAYENRSDHVETLAKIKAGAINVLVTATPDLWMYQTQRMEDLLLRRALPLIDGRVTIFDAADHALLSVGVPPDAPTLTESAPIFESGQLLGRVDVRQTYRDVVIGTIIAALLGLGLGAMVFTVLYALPVRALRRIAATLFDEQAALKRSEQHYRALFDRAGDGIIILTSGGKTVAVNEAFARMHGYRTDEMTGMSVADLAPAKSRQEIPERFGRVIEGETVTFEVEHYHKDGHVIPIEVSASLISSSGDPLIQAFHRDITERKKAEAERVQLEAQLRESQKMEALGTLAGGVAHDFNNMLATIMGNLDLARQDLGEDHPARESLEEIGKASRRAKALVQQILAFGRRQTLERKPISLAPMVDETVRLLRVSMPAASVRLSVDCAPDAPAVLGDATQLGQVLLNLCTNAWHAIETLGRPGTIKIRLRAYEHASGETGDPQRDFALGALHPGRYARLSVSDDGSGMDAATRRRIFEPFFTTKGVGKGTGLGLAVVHGIAQKHDACIEVRSAPGEGACFHLYFPAAQAPASATERPARKEKERTSNAKNLHILYLDDDEAIVLLMTRLLERRGYRVTGYTDPQAALAAVRADPRQFDLMVTDHNMPGMLGLEVANALKEIGVDMPVVLASGYINEELRAKAAAAGIREVIYKPNTTDELCEAVARMAHSLGKQTA